VNGLSSRMSPSSRPGEQVGGEARHEDGAELRHPRAELRRERRSVERSHAHVGQQQVDLGDLGPGEARGGARVDRHSVAGVREHVLDPLEARRVVVADGDALTVPDVEDRVVGEALGRRRARSIDGQVDAELGAGLGARQPHGPRRGRHDAVHGGEAEAGTAPRVLGREERLEDALADRLRDPVPAVAHREHRVLAGRERVAVHARFGGLERPQSNLQRAALGHRVARVRHEVQRDLLEARGRDANGRDLAEGVEVEAHVGPDDAPQERLHRTQRLERLRHGRALVGGANEVEELAREPRGLRDGLFELHQTAARLEARARRLAPEQLDVAVHHREEVVEVVRDAAGHAPERFHLVGVPRVGLARLERERHAARVRGDAQGVDLHRMPRAHDVARVEADEAPPERVGEDGLDQQRSDRLRLEERPLVLGKVHHVTDHRTAGVQLLHPARVADPHEVHVLQLGVVDLRLHPRRTPLEALAHPRVTAAARDVLEDVDAADLGRTPEHRQHVGHRLHDGRRRVEQVGDARDGVEDGAPARRHGRRRLGGLDGRRHDDGASIRVRGPNDLRRWGSPGQRLTSSDALARGWPTSTRLARTDVRFREVERPRRVEGPRDGDDPNDAQPRGNLVPSAWSGQAVHVVKVAVALLVGLCSVRVHAQEPPNGGAPLPDDAAVREALRTLDAAGDEDDPLGVGDVGTLRDVQVRAPRSEPTEALRVPPAVGEVLTAIPGVRETSHRVDVRWTPGLALIREEIVLRSTADHLAEARLRLPRPEGAWLVALEGCVDDRCVAAVPDASTRYDAAWIRAALEPRAGSASRAESPTEARVERPVASHAGPHGEAPSSPRGEPRPEARPLLLAADAHDDERGSAFSIHVAPIEPGRTYAVRVAWATPLSVVGGIARLTIPARGNDLRASAARVSFEPGDVLAPTLQGTSPEAAVEVDPWAPIALSGRLPSGALRASATSFSCGRARCVHVHAAAGSREGPREDVALLIDVSPSSFGPARGRLSPALASLLAALPAGSEVRAWAFAARAESLVDAPVRPTEIPFAALASATSLELGSSTRLDAALRAIGDARGAHALVVGDGGLTEGPHLDAAIAEAERRGQRLSVLSLVERPVHPRLVSAVERLGGRVLVVPSALFEASAAASLDGHVATLFAPRLGNVQVGRDDLGELRAGAALSHVGGWARGARVRVGRLEVPVREANDEGLRAALAALGRARAGEPTRLAWAPEIEGERSCEELTRATSAPSSRVDPWMSTDRRSCARPTAPSPAPSTLGRGIPAETVLSMLRRRVVPVARGCFRRDRAGREDYATRAVFELRLTDREVAAADVVGAIDDELRECLLHAVDGLEVPAYDGTIVVRYPLYTRAHGPAVTIELHPDVASAVDRVLPSDAPARPIP
jgi:hypothetical protein